MRYLATILTGLLLPLAHLPATAADADPYERFTNHDTYNEALEVPWVELETKVSELPREEDLTRLDIIGMPPRLSLYADLQNMDVSDKDYVTRLWLVVRSEQGAYNGTYEGIRCATGEYKIYAYANPAGRKPLRVVNVPRWRETRMGSYRAELMQDYLCRNALPRSPRDVRDNGARDAAAYVPAYAR